MTVKKKSKASAALGAGGTADAPGTGQAKKRRKQQESDSVGALAPPPEEEATAERGKKRKKAKGPPRAEEATAERGKKRKKTKGPPPEEETTAEKAKGPRPEEEATAERGKKRKKAKGKSAGLVDEASRRPAEDHGPVEAVETAPARLLAAAPGKRVQGEEEDTELEVAWRKEAAQNKQLRKGRAVQNTELSGNAAILESIMQKGGDADSDSDSLRNADFIPTPGTQDREESLKVFVGGLFWKLDAATVRKDFEECGPIQDFDMPNAKSDSGNIHTMGIAFIVYKTQQGVDNALSFDGDDYHGRQLNVKLSNPPKGKGRGSGKGEGKKGKGKEGKGGKAKGKGKGKGKKSRFEGVF